MLPASQLTADLVDAVTGVEIPFNGDADDYGVTWTMAEIDGWDSADLEEGAQGKAGQDGMWDTENFYGGRTISIKGKLVAPTYAAREAAAYRLAQAVPRNRLATFTMNETTPKWVLARRSGRLMNGPVTDTINEFSISMLAPDPRLYGATRVSGTITAAAAGGGLAPPWTPPVLIPASASAPSTITLTNTGIYDTPPVITFRGPGSDVSIYNYSTQLLLAYDIDLAASDFLVVDVASGVALLNGTAPRPPTTSSCVTSQFLLEPGDNLLKIFGTLTAVTPPSADIAFYSAWI